MQQRQEERAPEVALGATFHYMSHRDKIMGFRVADDQPDHRLSLHLRDQTDLSMVTTLLPLSVISR